MAVGHDESSVVGGGCDDQFEFEFEFALDILLDGFERLQRQGWNSAGRRRRNCGEAGVADAVDGEQGAVR